MAKKSKAPELPERIKFKYIFDQSYNPRYVNGAYGGLTSDKEIVVNFYFERSGLPYSQTMEVLSNGKLGPEIERNPHEEYPYFVRVVENGVILSLKSARKIHKWLGKKINELESVHASDDTKKSPPK